MMSYDESSNYLAGSWGVEPHTKSFGEISVQPTDPSYTIKIVFLFT